MKKYKALLFSVDGNYITDLRDRNTKEQVEKELENATPSAYFFYPLQFVIEDKGAVNPNQKVLSAGYPVEEWSGLSVGDIALKIKETDWNGWL